MKQILIELTPKLLRDMSQHILSTPQHIRRHWTGHYWVDNIG
jgi:hypothetical protein